MTSVPIEDRGSSGFGTIAIRVVVLPRKRKQTAGLVADAPLDLGPDELLPDVDEASPVTSYLERPKGGRLCCVFLVNGQRQDGMDNSFIVQQLGFKYLRKRMIVIVEVDGLQPEALGQLMQGSRQGFYKGSIWEAISNRLVATLRGDPEIQKLEDDAEAEVARLEAGDEKVREALDMLIEAHHHYGDHAAAGPGGADLGPERADSVLGVANDTSERVVSLLSPSKGSPSDYPVLVSQPEVSSLHLRPDQQKLIVISSNPPNAWPALASFTHLLDPRIPELQLAENRTAESVVLTLRFREPADWDPEDYPLRTTLRVLGKFNGFAETRQCTIALTIKPVTPTPAPVLLPDPTFLRVTTRQPVHLWRDSADTHVRLRWDGDDDLVLRTNPWTFSGRCLTPTREDTRIAFSEPSRGRFAAVIGISPDAQVGEELAFEVVASGPNSECLGPVQFTGIVADRPPKPEVTPRMTTGTVPTGALRRPPYELKYVKREAWHTGTCFGQEDWGPEDAGAFQDPTERAPLTLLVNTDLQALDDFRTFLTSKKLTENEIQARLQKYTSHVAFHLYQMYQATQTPSEEEDGTVRLPRPDDQGAEVRRVAMTLLRLMQVSR
jgi:hypothetical protein